jgi:Rod binding domain-containing protein
MAGPITATTSLLSTVPAGNTLSPAQIAKTQKTAKDFEAMALGEMLKPMFDTVDTSKGLFGGGIGEATWKPMMVEEMAKSIAQGGGVGIADEVMKEMLSLQDKAHG